MIIHPEISVILSTYNRNRPDGACPSLVKRAILSILNQTFFDFELILIDDASTDGTQEICESFASRDGRIRYIRHTQNTQLPAKCYNEGIAQSQGKFLAFMFDDDEWFPTALSDLHAYYYAEAAKNKGYLGMVYGQVIYYNVAKDQIYHSSFGSFCNYKILLSANYIANCAVLIKKEVIEIVGGYDEHPIMRRICDWDLWLRISELYPIALLPKLVGRVNGSQPDSIETNFSLDMSAVNNHQKTRKYLPLKTKKLTNYQKILFKSRSATVFLLLFKRAFTHKIKALLKKIGCYNLAKSLYELIKA